MLVIKIMGKAQTVFAVLELMDKKAGKLTTSEIIRLKSR